MKTKIEFVVFLVCLMTSFSVMFADHNPPPDVDLPIEENGCECSNGAGSGVEFDGSGGGNTPFGGGFGIPSESAGSDEYEGTSNPVGRLVPFVDGAHFEISFGRLAYSDEVAPGKLIFDLEKPFAGAMSKGYVRYEHPTINRIIPCSPSFISISIYNGTRQERFYPCESLYGSILPDYLHSGHSTGSMDILEGHSRPYLDPYVNDMEIYWRRPDGITTYHESDNGFDQIKRLCTQAGAIYEEAQYGIMGSPRGHNYYNYSGYYSATDGFMEVEDIPGRKGILISWYPLTSIQHDSYGVRVTGPALKTYRLTYPQTGNYNKLRLEEVRVGTTLKFVYEWEYKESVNAWTLTQGEGANAVVTERRLGYDGAGAVQMTEIKKSGVGVVAVQSARQITPYQTGSQYTGGVNGAGEPMSRTVYSDSGITRGKVMSVIYPDDAATENKYDSSGRLIKVVYTYPDAPTKEILYTYLDNSYFSRPATMTVIEGGVQIAKTTYEYIYKTVPNVFLMMECTIRETLEKPGLSSQVMEKVYYPSVNTYHQNLRFFSLDTNSKLKVSTGKLKSIRRADNTMTTYEYSDVSIPDEVNTKKLSELPTYTVVETSGVYKDGGFAVVPGKSVRKRYIRNAAGEILEEQRFVHTGSDFARINFITYDHNPAHQVTYVFQTAGRQSSYEWICAGKIVYGDIFGNGTYTEYDGAKRPFRVTKLGKVSTRVFDADGNVIQETVAAEGDPSLKQVVTHEYDKSGRRTKTTDAQGLVTRFEVSADGLTRTVIHPGGGTEITRSFSDGSVRSVTGTAVTPTFYTYGRDGNLKWTKRALISADGPQWQTSYTDAGGRLVKTIRSSIGSTTVTTENEYDALGRLVRIVTDGAPEQKFYYDEFGSLVKTETIADGITRTQENTTVYAPRDDRADIIQTSKVYCSDPSITPLITTTKYQLSDLCYEDCYITDVRGNQSRMLKSMVRGGYLELTNALFPNGLRLQEMNYETKSNTVRQSADQQGFTTDYTYDGLDRVTSTIEQREHGKTTLYTYNDKGQLATSTVLHEWDGVLDYTEETAYFYSNLTGLLTAVRDPMGHFTRYAYDVKGQKIAEYGDGVHPKRFEYDDYGRLTAYYTYRSPDADITTLPEPAQGDKVRFEYDNATGLQTAKIFPNSDYERYDYYVDGKLFCKYTSCTYEEYGYNGFGQLTEINPQLYMKLYKKYDAMGRVIELHEPQAGDKVTVFEYDNYGQVIRELTDGPLQRDYHYDYDEYGRPCSYGYLEPYCNPVSISYDNRGRPANTSIYGTDVDYEYVENTNLPKKMIYYGWNTIPMTKSFEYEPGTRRVTAVTTTVGDTVILSQNYTHDHIGRIITSARTCDKGSRSANYAYTPRGELDYMESSNNSSAFTYDNIGNRVTSQDNVVPPISIFYTYEPNSSNQYSYINHYNYGTMEYLGGTQPVFDGAGRQTTVLTSTGTWDISYGDNGCSVFFTQGDTVIEMNFDSMHRRVSKKVTVAGVVTSHLLFNHRGYKVSHEYDVLRGRYNACYLWEEPTDASSRLLGMRYYPFTDADNYNREGGLPQWKLDELEAQGHNKAYHFHWDTNKNITHVTDEDGKIVAHYEYSAFGRIVSSEGDFADSHPFRFSCEYYDKELGLLAYNYRFYNPLDGRFFSRDPISESGGYNLYGFCNNDPINNTDYLGMKFKPTEESKGKTRRVYKSDQKNGDLKIDLATRVKLDHDEFSKWARDIQYPVSTGADPTDRICSASVPNVGYIDVATYSHWTLGYFLMNGYRPAVQLEWEVEGLKVEYSTYLLSFESTISTVIKNHFSSSDIYKFMFIGHGNDGAIAMGIFPQTTSMGLTSDDLSVNHRFSELRIIACYANTDFPGWQRFVSKKGKTYLGEGRVSFNNFKIVVY